MTFRPYPGLTVACAILFAILCGLGFWQGMIRLPWKLQRIALMNSHLSAAPVDLDHVLKLEGDEAQYRHVILSGHFDHAKETYVFTTGGGTGVYHVLTPFITDNGRALLVDRGLVTKERLDPSSRASGNVAGETQIIGVWRTPDRPGLFTPAPDLAHRIWYSRDLADIAANDRILLSVPVIIEADAAPNPGGWPKGGQTVVDLPNNHLSYAITWFGLALCLLGVWLAYHISKGRLAWKRR
jgi:surfeit locus 1 family protein